MKRNVILTIIFVSACLSDIFSQCDVPVAPGLSCETAIAFCNNEIHNYCSTTFNSSVQTFVNMPPFCGSVQNNQWLQFVAGTTTISLRFTVDNCQNDDGLQAMVMHSDDCLNFTGISNCSSETTSGNAGGVSVFYLDSDNYVIGETYYLMIDGWLGDNCDYLLEVVDGSTSVPSLEDPEIPLGNTSLCSGANSISYSIPVVVNAIGYNWTVPPGSTFTMSDDELSIDVDFASGLNSGEICVEAFNDCETGSQICLPITFQNLSATNELGEYCEGDSFFYIENNISYTAGIHEVLLPGGSTQGCDSLVLLEVIEKPTVETFLIETICEGDAIEVSGIFFNQTNENIEVVLNTSEGCDSIVHLDLTVLNTQIVLEETESINCENQTVEINAIASNADAYHWTAFSGNIISGQGTPTIMVDEAGFYELTTTIENQGVSCSNTSSIFINENYEIPQFNITTSDLSCSESNNGSASITTSGGVPPFTYQWSTGDNSPIVSDLMSGAYTVTVTGANNCQAIEAFIITEPFALNYDIVLGSTICNGDSNGTASITPSGGIGPYTYLWSTGTTSNVEAGLAPGNYEVIITDANACSVVENFEILEPDPVTLTVENIQSSCSGLEGSATVIASGGVGALSYLWSGTPIQTTPTATGLLPGDYIVNVYDQNNCSASIDVTIEESPSIQISISGVNPTCYNESDGSVTVIASGGVGNLTFEWNSNNSQNLPTLNNLEAGFYEVTITDENGCAAISNTEIFAPDEITISSEINNVTCFDGVDGAIDITISGGVIPYDFEWQNSSQDMEDLTGLSAGIYSLIVTDANNCTAQTAVNIQEPPSIQTSFSVIGTSCGDANGSIDVTTSGGVTPYSFQWSNDTALEDPQGLTIGNYEVTVTDANDCFVIDDTMVENPNQIMASTEVINVLCNGDNSGSISMSVTGGQAPYSFSWDSGLGAIQNPSNLSAGLYTVIITDANNCEQIIEVEVTEPQPLVINEMITNITCYGAENGTINLLIEGGIPPYNLDWNTGQNTLEISGLSVGIYSAIITDSQGCTITHQVEVLEPTTLEVFFLEPIAVSCNGFSDGGIVMEVNGGTPAYSFDWNENDLDGQQNPEGLIAGTYSITVSDLNACTATSEITISEPSTINIQSVITPVTCFDGEDGAINLQISGGIEPYGFNWNNGLFSQEEISNLSSGDFEVLITDANDCTQTATFFLGNPLPVQYEIQNISDYNGYNVSCENADDGFVELLAQGGLEPYDFLGKWNDKQSTRRFKSRSL